MKNRWIVAACAAVCWTASAQTTAPYAPAPENLQARTAFQDAKFGIFLHWGLYSMLGSGEWTMTNRNINYQEYAKLANAFYPHDFDAAEWVSAIKSSGAGYVCFTTRHHDGFSMWDTAQTDYDIVDATPYKQDIVKALSDECARQDIRLHLYYSLIDWYRDDCPRGRTGLGTGRPGTAISYERYYDFMKRQLTELLTDYGPVGGSWVCPKADIAAGNFEKITKLCKEARAAALGFEVAHVGVNCEDADAASAVCEKLNKAFDLPVKDGNSSMFASSGIEVMKSMFKGKNGHIAIRTNSVELAVAGLAKKGFAYDESSAKYKNGRMTAAYLKDEFGGFAVHLLQK